MKQLGWVCGVFSFSLAACGGRANAPGDTQSGGGASSSAGKPNTQEVAGAMSNAGSPGSADAGAPGVGPIDSTDLPTQFPEPLCVGPLASLHLALPCKVGNSIGGAVSVVECYDTKGRTALDFSVDLVSAAKSIGTPVALPFDGGSGLPAFPLPPITTEGDGVNYEGVLNGSLTFEQVDPEGRAFVGSLTREFVAWTAPDGTETDCDYDPMRLWATPGDFL